MTLEITKSEWAVMEVLWPLGRATTREVYERIAQAGDFDWTFSTVKTLLLRLEEKEIIRGAKYGRSVTYEVVVKKPTALQRAFDRFLEHFTGGDPAPFASYLAESRKLSKEDIESLKKIVSDYEKVANRKKGEKNE